jgi:hypothetical protein
MPREAFEPATYALDRATTGIGLRESYFYQIYTDLLKVCRLVDWKNWPTFILLAPACQRYRTTLIPKILLKILMD